ncbi:hypothetical protein ACYPKM_01765 [Pseudomonas aeruginosa]
MQPENTSVAPATAQPLDDSKKSLWAIAKERFNASSWAKPVKTTWKFICDVAGPICFLVVFALSLQIGINVGSRQALTDVAVANFETCAQKGVGDSNCNAVYRALAAQGSSTAYYFLATQGRTQVLQGFTGVNQSPDDVARIQAELRKSDVNLLNAARNLYDIDLFEILDRLHRTFDLEVRLKLRETAELSGPESEEGIKARQALLTGLTQPELEYLNSCYVKLKELNGSVGQIYHFIFNSPQKSCSMPLLR